MIYIGRLASCIAAFYLLACSSFNTISEFTPYLDHYEVMENSKETEEENTENSWKEFECLLKDPLGFQRVPKSNTQKGIAYKYAVSPLPEVPFEVSTPPPEA